MHHFSDIRERELVIVIQHNRLILVIRELVPDDLFDDVSVSFGSYQSLRKRIKVVIVFIYLVRGKSIFVRNTGLFRFFNIKGFVIRGPAKPRHQRHVFLDRIYMVIKRDVCLLGCVLGILLVLQNAIASCIYEP